MRPHAPKKGTAEGRASKKKEKKEKKKNSKQHNRGFNTAQEPRKHFKAFPNTHSASEKMRD
jgi:hypothetical protein